MMEVDYLLCTSIVGGISEDIKTNQSKSTLIRAESSRQLLVSDTILNKMSQLDIKLQSENPDSIWAPS